MTVWLSTPLDYLDKLVYAIYDDRYFSDYLSAKAYIDKIIHYVEDNISEFPAKTTPERLVYLGKFYLFYKANNRTTWFIFFYKRNEDFVVTGILNNHIQEANLLNK
ncbi:MAG: hypothetical protein AAF688_11500 [Bacteroidota bacterium]